MIGGGRGIVNGEVAYLPDIFCWDGYNLLGGTMSHEVIATNLRRFRTARGLTQEQVAEASGISRVAYRNLETGVSAPRPETLHALARALDVAVGDLATPVPELRHVRFRSFRRLNTREQILLNVGRWLRDFNDLEDILDDRVEHTLRSLASDLSGGDASPEEAAFLVRRRLGLTPEEPVRDICGLLEANGIKVLPLRIASDAFFGLSVAETDGGPAVVVNTWERISVERWIFTAAHELGHLILHLQDYEADRKDEEERHEKEANLFAAHFLMPHEVFRKEWEETYGMALVDRVLKIKRMFRVSYRTVLYRLSESSSFGPGIWRRFQAEYQHLHGRTLLKDDEPEALAADAFRATFPEPSRAGEPEDLSPADFMEDRLLRLVRQAVEREEITLSRGAEILGMSLLEMRQLASSWVG
jgi:Zn-dependent peptidase ImmA (M78 family)/DNA-binding XRE family transcriptional regulator